MCHQTTCPNDGKKTWWGCGRHIESALKGVPAEDRCDCPHERNWIGFYVVKKQDLGAAKEAVKS